MSSTNSNLLFYITTDHPSLTQGVRRLLASRTEILTLSSSTHEVTMAQDGDTEQPQEATNRKVRPVITPDAFSGEPMESWDDWLGHFESVAKVNGWNENTCLLWLEVRLTGKAHNTWRRLSNEARAHYSMVKAALCKRFESDSRREVYMAEFHTRKRNPGKRWEIFYTNADQFVNERDDLLLVMSQKLFLLMKLFLKLSHYPSVELYQIIHLLQTLIQMFLTLGPLVYAVL